MPSMLTTLTSLVVLALSLTRVAPALGQDACLGKKLKAIGKKEARLIFCHAKVALKGDPSPFAACVQKAETKYSAAFVKAGTCSGDQGVCECLAENCASAVHAALPDAGPSKCESARLKAAGKKAAGKLRCNAKAAAKGLHVDQDCINKVNGKYQAAFAKVTSCSGDQGTVEDTVDQRCVTDVGADAMGGGKIDPICESCVPMTTTTTVAGGSTTTSTTVPTGGTCCQVYQEPSHTPTGCADLDPGEASGECAGQTYGSQWDPLESTCRHASLSIL